MQISEFIGYCGISIEILSVIFMTRNILFKSDKSIFQEGIKHFGYQTGEFQNAICQKINSQIGFILFLLGITVNVNRELIAKITLLNNFGNIHNLGGSLILILAMIVLYKILTFISAQVSKHRSNKILERMGIVFNEGKKKKQQTLQYYVK